MPLQPITFGLFAALRRPIGPDAWIEVTAIQPDSAAGFSMSAAITELRFDPAQSLAIAFATRTVVGHAAPRLLTAVTAAAAEPMPPDRRNGFVVPGRPPLVLEGVDDARLRIRGWLRHLDPANGDLPPHVAQWQTQPVLDLTIRLRAFGTDVNRQERDRSIE